MFDRTYIHSEDNSREAARILDGSIARFGNKLAEISREEVKARDRVDITLAEYERMKNLISDLSAENRRLRGVFEKIGVPADLPIIQDSIRRYYAADYMSFRQQDTIRIEFKIDTLDLSPEQRKEISYNFGGIRC